MKVKVGSRHLRGGGHSRPSKGHIRRQRKTIDVAGITARQGNCLADNMVKGRARASRRVCQTAKECEW